MVTLVKPQGATQAEPPLCVQIVIGPQKKGRLAWYRELPRPPRTGFDDTRVPIVFEHTRNDERPDEGQWCRAEVEIRTVCGEPTEAVVCYVPSDFVSASQHLVLLPSTVSNGWTANFEVGTSEQARRFVEIFGRERTKKLWPGDADPLQLGDRLVPNGADDVCFMFSESPERKLWCDEGHPAFGEHKLQIAERFRPMLCRLVRSRQPIAWMELLALYDGAPEAARQLRAAAGFSRRLADPAAAVLDVEIVRRALVETGAAELRRGKKEEIDPTVGSTEDFVRLAEECRLAVDAEKNRWVGIIFRLRNALEAYDLRNAIVETDAEDGMDLPGIGRVPLPSVAHYYVGR